YGMIKNELARQYNKKGEKLLIHDDLEGDWLWIDDSKSLSELEVGGKKAIVRSSQVQKWWNNHKKYGFEVTPEFVLNGFKDIQEDRKEFKKEIKEFAIALNRHIPAYEGMAKFTENLGKEIRLLRTDFRKVKKENTKLRLKTKHQTTLNNY
ncbi:hypothetical protein LCGC14_1613680, partial [marine sediment metagenome]